MGMAAGEGLGGAVAGGIGVVAEEELGVGPMESQRGRRPAVPAVEPSRQSAGRPGAGSRMAERESTALSVSRMAAGGLAR